MLDDGNEYNEYPFDVKVISKPIFKDGTTSFSEIKVALGTVKSFPLPAFYDPDNDTVSLSVVDTSGGTAPTWI